LSYFIFFFTSFINYKLSLYELSQLLFLFYDDFDQDFLILFTLFDNYCLNLYILIV
jgi:hypothetical protein